MKTVVIMSYSQDYLVTFSKQHYTIFEKIGTLCPFKFNKKSKGVHNFSKSPLQHLDKISKKFKKELEIKQLRQNFYRLRKFIL